MSRTDKDRPWQIRANDQSDLDNGAYWFHYEWDHRRTGSCTDRCGWTLSHCVLTHPPHDFVHVVWYGPERARERVQLARMAGQYNGDRFLDEEDFPNYQHRHMAHRLWC